MRRGRRSDTAGVVVGAVVQQPPEQPPLSVDGRIAAVCGRQHGVAHERQLAGAGLTRAARRWRERTGRLFRIHQCVFALTPTLSDDGYRAAALLATNGTLSHESTLCLAGLAGAPDSQHITIVGSGRRSVPGITIHHTRAWAPGDVTRVRGLRTTTVARALLDVAPTAVNLRALVHEAQYRKFIDPLSLRAIVTNHRGHPGLARLAAIEPAAGDSGLERRLGKILPPGATRQVWLSGLSGKRYRADYAYVEERVFIEADGRDAHARMLAFDDDRARDNDIAATGWLPLRYTASHMASPDTIRAQVDEVRRTRRRPSPTPRRAAPR